MWSNLEGLNQVPSEPAVSPDTNIAQILSSNVSGSELTRQLDAWINTPLRMDKVVQPSASEDKGTVTPPGSETPQMVFSQMYNNAYKQAFMPSQRTVDEKPESFPASDWNNILMQIVNGGLKDQPQTQVSSQAQPQPQPQAQAHTQTPAPTQASTVSSIALPPIIAPVNEAVQQSGSITPPPAKRARSTSTSRSTSVVEELSSEDDKRRRNTAASARFRAKKKQREEAMKRLATELEERVTVLTKELNTLKSENKWLRSLVLEKTDVAANNNKA